MTPKRKSLFLHLFDIFTILVWLWLVIEFLTKGKINLPEIVSTIYLLILTTYVGDKEIRRWKKKYISRWRKGEYFVYLWGLTLVVIVGIYIWGGNRLGFRIPHELPTITGSVLILYIITQFLKEGVQEKRLTKR